MYRMTLKYINAETQQDLSNLGCLWDFLGTSFR